jgi:hypothetical protein
VAVRQSWCRRDRGAGRRGARRERGGGAGAGRGAHRRRGRVPPRAPDAPPAGGGRRAAGRDDRRRDRSRGGVVSAGRPSRASLAGGCAAATAAARTPSRVHPPSEIPHDDSRRRAAGAPRASDERGGASYSPRSPWAPSRRRGAQGAPPAPAPTVARLGSCRLASGATIPTAAWRTRAYGPLNAARDNVVLVPTFFAGRSEDHAFMLGTYVDTTRYHVVIVDALADGPFVVPVQLARCGAGRLRRPHHRRHGRVAAAVARRAAGDRAAPGRRRHLHGCVPGLRVGGTAPLLRAAASSPFSARPAPRRSTGSCTRRS